MIYLLRAAVLAVSCTLLFLLLIHISPRDRFIGVTAGILQPPTITPGGGEYKQGIKVRIEALGGEEIHYTTDGGDPSCASDSIFESRISLIADTTIRAVSCGMGGQSFETRATYTFIGSSKAGNSSSDPTEAAGVPDCTIDPVYCPPRAPSEGIAATNLEPPLFGAVLGNLPTITASILTEGDAGTDVAFLQLALGLHDPIRLTSADPFGYYGQMTKESVIRFQRTFHITPANGKADSMTLARLRTILGQSPVHFPQ